MLVFDHSGLLLIPWYWELPSFDEFDLSSVDVDVDLAVFGVDFPAPGVAGDNSQLSFGN